MKTRYKQFNPKRRIAPSGHASQVALDALAQRVSYGGNPEHKRSPGGFGLTPPSAPRPGKSLCDAADLFRRSEALHLLQTGVRKGLISDRHEGEWPKNVWSVTSSGIPLEAQLENAAQGVYHGYPMPESTRSPPKSSHGGACMTDFRLDLDWQATGDADRLLSDTSARLAIRLGDACLTRNLDT